MSDGRSSCRGFAVIFIAPQCDVVMPIRMRAMSVADEEHGPVESTSGSVRVSCIKCLDMAICACCHHQFRWFRRSAAFYTCIHYMCVIMLTGSNPYYEH